VALIASTPNLLVVPAASPLNNVNDLVNAAKRSAPTRPLTFGSPGVGSSVHLAGELFKSMAGVDMTHVPYKGVSAAEVDLVGGTIDLMFDSISTAAPLAQAGRLKTIAVTGLQRVKALPQVPTMAELGMKNFEVEATYMVIAPAKTPPAAIQRLSVAIAEVTAQPDVQRVVEALYARPLTGGPAETKAFLAAEERKWQDLVKRSNLKID
jgi:tripartite-type tricarboxylate transporter receptor subunit TctC